MSSSHHLLLYNILSTSLGENSSFSLGEVGIPDLTRCSSNHKAKRYQGEEGILDLRCGVIRKRRTPALTYEFDDEFPDAAKPAVLRAFASWEEPLNFTFSFSFLGAGEADIVIGMYSGDHGDPHPFKAGPGGVLAHASSPPHGELHFNSEQPWLYDLVLPPVSGELFFDFQSVAVHEIGHLLGLEHIDNPKAVMYEFINPREIRRGLTVADAAELKFIYSGDPNFD